MSDTYPPTPTGLTYPSRAEDVARGVRLECLRLAAETGMKADAIQPTAEQWTDFVLGTNKKEN
ncbi:hypothetical protein JVX90_00070 [Gordonia sp. PDNC005]|uniref:hypothetical protein n=1 Tax=Gordonia sp. PDNC005 TaxID=2811424 RepID=UPI00196689B2|nr:hypothetical protein [Gordonia sp. PDNC005]QRY62708.1 hypothetical protein JVX90_00070 [Gordonia sp. PDNC005]